MCMRRDARPRRGWFVRGMIGVVAALVLAGCGSASKAAQGNATARTLPAASAQAAAASLPSVDAGIEVYGNCKTPSVEPAEIVLACADYNAVLEALHWTSWTAASATAVGILVYNDCTPNCAEGHFHHVPGTRVTLTVHGGPQPLPKGPI